MTIIQNAMPPFTMTCTACKQSWQPAPVTRGATRGQITDASLDKAAKDHWKGCPGE